MGFLWLIVIVSLLVGYLIVWVMIKVGLSLWLIIWCWRVIILFLVIIGVFLMMVVIGGLFLRVRWLGLLKYGYGRIVNNILIIINFKIWIFY